ncbi:MAG TPA: ABC transporter permease [Miltoncostaeaceae bacterium]|nr:ABC transporter permease [Miltoncostaeaceae bacterium]
MLRATLRNLSAARLRLALTALAVVLGVAFVAGTFILSDTTGRAMDGEIAAAGGGTDVVVRGAATVSADAREPLPDALLATVLDVPGVSAVAGRATGAAELVDPAGGTVSGSWSAEAWAADPDLRPWRLRAGRAPATAGEIALDAAAARRAGLGVGDRVQVHLDSGAHRVTVTGLAGHGTAEGASGRSVILLAAGAARTLLHAPGWESVAADAAPGVDAEALRGRVAAVLPPGVEAVTGAQAMADARRDADASLALIRNSLLAFGLVSLFVAAFMIVNAFAITVAQRVRQAALMRALGASRGQVTRAVMTEALLVGLVASALGIAAGLAVARALSALLASSGLALPSDGLVLTVPTVLIALGIGVGVTLAAALRPALRAGRVAPLAALRDSAAPRDGHPLRRRVVAVALTAAGTGLIAAGLLADGVDPWLALGLGAAVLFLGAAGLMREAAGPLLRVLSGRSAASAPPPASAAATRCATRSAPPAPPRRS